MLSTHLMLLEVVDEILEVAEATPETEEEIVDVDKEVNDVELEFGMITADELELELDDVLDEVELEVGIITADELKLELELLEVLEETSVDVVLELDTTDWDGAGTATEELGLLEETAALEAEELDANTALLSAISQRSETWKSDMCNISTKEASGATQIQRM